MVTERLFFALRPNAPCAARIHQLTVDLCRSLGLAGRPLAMERLHMTLCFLGEYADPAPALLAAAAEAGSGLPHACFELVLNRVMSFPHTGEAPVVLCPLDNSAPLTQLRAGLCAALARTARFAPDPREFKPHVTLLYARQAVPPQNIAPVAWTVTEVLLIRSRIGQGRHEVLGRYPLR